MTKVAVLTFMIMLNDMMALENKQRQGWYSAKMEWWEQELVCTSVFIIVVLEVIVRKRRCLGGCCPRGLPPSSATSTKVCLFQSWQQWREAGGEKRNDCFMGRHWSIVNAACSFSWPVTCIVVGFLVWGGQTAGGTAGGADGQLGQFQEREEEESKSMRQRDERGKAKGESVCWGIKEKRKEKERADEVTEVLAPHLQVYPLCSCVSALA